MRYIIPLAFLCLFLNTTTIAQTLGIVTGGEKGTYYAIGKDISETVRRDGIRLQVHASSGSLVNIYSVYKEPFAQLGIVQSDVLAFIQTKKQASLIPIARKTRMVYPLYNEEVHILARNNIIDLEDLNEKRVAIGSEGSGSFLTSKMLFTLSDINPSFVLKGGGDALGMLKNGEIDAMVYVAGYPVKLFTQDVRNGDGLKLIEITNKSILEVYRNTSTIPSSTYNWQTDSVNTVAVKAVLITYDYKNNNCRNVGKIARSISNNIDWLRSNGHSKWNDVDLDYRLHGWTQYECVKSHRNQRKRNDNSGLKDFFQALELQE